MIAESGALIAPRVDQCTASIAASASTLTQRGHKFMPISNFMPWPA